MFLPVQQDGGDAGEHNGDSVGDNKPAAAAPPPLNPPVAAAAQGQGQALAGKDKGVWHDDTCLFITSFVE